MADEADEADADGGETQDESAPFYPEPDGTPDSRRDYDEGLPDAAPVPLYQLFRYLDAHEITAYPRPACLTPGPDLDVTLVDSIVADMAATPPPVDPEAPLVRYLARTPEDVLADVRYWCAHNPGLPPAPPVPAPIGAEEGPRPVRRPQLCTNGCCMECPACSARVGVSDVLCQDCLFRRAMCDGMTPEVRAAVQASVAGAAPPDPSKPPPLAESKQKVAANLRRIGIGLLELSGAVSHNATWLLRHSVAAAQSGMEKGGEVVAKGVSRTVDRYLVDPLVVALMRLAARVDGGLVPRNGTREAVLAMVYGPDKSTWPAWIRVED